MGLIMHCCKGIGRKPPFGSGLCPNRPIAQHSAEGDGQRTSDRFGPLIFSRPAPAGSVSAGSGMTGCTSRHQPSFGVPPQKHGAQRNLPAPRVVRWRRWWHERGAVLASGRVTGAETVFGAETSEFGRPRCVGRPGRAGGARSCGAAVHGGVDGCGTGRARAAGHAVVLRLCSNAVGVSRSASNVSSRSHMTSRTQFLSQVAA